MAATALALAERLNFSPRELHLMRAAGHLHNLGKLSVPTSILDTIGGRPQIREWAAFHHERLDGAVWREAW